MHISIWREKEEIVVLYKLKMCVLYNNMIVQYSM